MPKQRIVLSDGIIISNSDNYTLLHIHYTATGAGIRGYGS